MGTKTKLCNLMTELRREYDDACAQSRDNYLSTLAPGAIVPKHGQLYSEADKAAFNKKIEKYKSEAKAVFDAARRTERVRFAATPSAEAVNAVAVLAARDKVSNEEVDALMERFSDNKMTQATIADIAKQKGVRVTGFVPLKDRLHAIDDAERNVDHALSISGLEKGGLFRYMVDNDLADVFGEE